ncbi:unnamed protein product [Rotaria sordida]|uniref:SHSP domain-containing protein n=1 Tax=Rotaria sordida TaxID=392033 RepID=A0A813MML0_9BILA|nr:unnamed protein product [Rotaria sordida]
MSSQSVSIHRTNNSLETNSNNKNDISFDAFNYTPGQDQHIRWLSRPSVSSIRNKYSHDTEKFRITFDVENFQPDQIKIYIQNRKLTITGVYEEHREGLYTQKQFEKSFDLPNNADVSAIASYITPGHMLVVEMPLDPNFQHLPAIDHLSVNQDLNDQRRLSFSLNKFNTLNNQGLLSPSNNTSNSPLQGQQVRRTSITKTTTTTTSTGSTGLPPEATELLRSAELSTGTTPASNIHITERRLSNTGNQPIIINEPTSLATTKTTNSTLADLSELPIEIPPGLLATGGTITIQKRKVSVTKTTDPNLGHHVSVPMTNSKDTHSSLSTTSHTSTPSTLQQSHTGERRGSQTTTTNQRHTFTLEEFLQNKTWNPSIIDGANGKKILHMRLEMKPGTKSDQLKITLNGHNLRVDVENKVLSSTGQHMNEQSYRQINLFPTCEVDQLKTELQSDGFLHIHVPIKL